MTNEQDNLFRAGAEKVNANFSEIYTAIGDVLPLVLLNLLMIVQRYKYFCQW